MPPLCFRRMNSPNLRKKKASRHAIFLQMETNSISLIRSLGYLSVVPNIKDLTRIERLRFSGNLP